MSSAFRKAGVWLGLVEEDDDRGYDDRNYRESSYRGRERDRDRDRYSSDHRYADELADEDEVEEERPVPRSRAERSGHSRLGERVSTARADLDREESDRLDRASVRSITPRSSLAP